MFPTQGGMPCLPVPALQANLPSSGASDSLTVETRNSPIRIGLRACVGFQLPRSGEAKSSEVRT
jgi:hypothetical protein